MHIVYRGNDILARVTLIQSLEVFNSFFIFVDVELTVVIASPSFYCVPDSLIYVMLHKSLKTLLFTKVLFVQAGLFDRLCLFKVLKGLRVPKMVRIPQEKFSS
jgi:hypothetical protein